LRCSKVTTGVTLAALFSCSGCTCKEDGMKAVNAALCGGGLQRPTCLSCSRILSLKRTGTFGFERSALNDYVRCYLEAVHVAS